MAHIIHAAPRLTHKFAPGYADMDDYGTYRAYKVLGAVTLRHGDGESYLGTVRHRVIGHKSVRRSEQERALLDAFNVSRCRHEHDCCGCVHTTARVSQVKPGIFSVVQSAYRNV